MKTLPLVVVSMTLSSAAMAAEPIWFVAVYGESMQHISGASGTPNVEDGVYLDTDFVGTEIYVRTVEGYELDGFRPYESATPSAATSSISAAASSVSEATDSVPSASAPEAEATSEFGPLSDTGVQYYVNYDYFGWTCDALYVKPMGDGVDRLRCDTEMSHSN